MPRPAFPKNLTEFQKWFPNEAACEDYLVRSRWPDGFICPHCGSKNHYEIRAVRKSRSTKSVIVVRYRKRLWECRDCGKQTSATSGTVLDHTRLALSVWFVAAFAMATDKRGVSALFLDRQLDLGNHKTAWFALHKMRRAMVNPSRTKLKGIVEMDGTFIGGYQPGLKAGRQRKGRKAACVLVAVEVLTRTRKMADGTERVEEYSSRLRVEFVRGETAQCVGDFLDVNVEPGATIRSDGLGAYQEATRVLGYKHIRIFQGKIKDTGQVVPLAHRSISNLKTWINGTHHGVGRPHLQAYLDEFVFRFNRRMTPEAASRHFSASGPITRRSAGRPSWEPRTCPTSTRATRSSHRTATSRRRLGRRVFRVGRVAGHRLAGPLGRARNRLRLEDPNTDATHGSPKPFRARPETRQRSQDRTTWRGWLACARDPQKESRMMRSSNRRWRLGVRRTRECCLGDSHGG
jgi:transposase-like protein